MVADKPSRKVYRNVEQKRTGIIYLHISPTSRILLRPPTPNPIISPFIYVYLLNTSCPISPVPPLPTTANLSVDSYREREERIACPVAPSPPVGAAGSVVATETILGIVMALTKHCDSRASGTRLLGFYLELLPTPFYKYRVTSFFRD